MPHVHKRVGNNHTAPISLVNQKHYFIQRVDKMSQAMTVTDANFVISGTVKWFDPVKGFGFIEPVEGGPDVLLHANVLRNYGVNSVSEGSRLEVNTRRSDHGVQAFEVHSITPPAGATDDGPVVRFNDIEKTDLVPARIKWYSSVKGYGFANAYGHSEDIFVAASVLRECGLAEVSDGEAVCLKIM